MSEIFNGIMRAISSLLGLGMVALGSIWTLQGLNIAFRVGPMVGDKQWVLWGALLVLVGAAQIWWSNSRERYYKGK